MIMNRLAAAAPLVRASLFLGLCALLWRPAYGQTFQWPLDSWQFSGSPPNDYGTYGEGAAYKYHTGIDMKSGLYDPSLRTTPVKAAAAGTVSQVYSISTCPNRADPSTATNSHGFGNVVVLSHANGKYTLYGHLDCVMPAISNGANVELGQQLGIMGNSTTKQQDPGGVGVHVHFEIKDYGEIGNRTFDGPYWGYTPDLPDGYGYHDPRIYISPISAAAITPMAIKVTNSTGLNVRTGPDPATFPVLTTLSQNQEFVAFEQSGTWYHIYLPNVGGPSTGWIAGADSGTTYSVEDPSATQIEVYGTGAGDGTGTGGGLLIRPSAGATTLSQAYDATYSDTTPTCRSAKVWDGQRFVTSANESGWYQFYLPANPYFDSAAGCAPPPSPSSGPSSGWSSGTYLRVYPAGAQLVEFQTNSTPVFVPTGGTASAVGTVYFFATNPGTMRATGVLSLYYDPPLASGATAVVTCAAAADCTYGANFTVSASGHTVTVTFMTDVTFNFWNSVSISGVHLNVSGFPSGVEIYASASGTASFDFPREPVALVVDTPPASPAVSLSPTSLTFSNQAVGTTSSPQSVTLTNSGNAALTITSVATIGDFGQTNACGSSLAAGAHCSINVTFTPTAAGTRLGMLTITTNAAGPDGVTLSGTGVALKRRGQLVSE